MVRKEKEKEKRKKTKKKVRKKRRRKNIVHHINGLKEIFTQISQNMTKTHLIKENIDLCHKF